ncbi:MAG TPA: PKD domain-containing protein [Chitinophagales bacterium]|nr:PKD domain-containing protein [Chitinophagales bacterium]
MKKILLSVFSILCSFAVYSQFCNSQRYQDTIFHQVTMTTYKFGSATPFGVLAQPQDLYLDFYEPTGDTLTKRPLIVFQFGGGFTIGWRSEPVIPQFCEYFAKCGYAVASIDYRIGLNPLDTNSTVRAYYRGVQDERSALRYMCQRADQFKFDTSLIILTGTSAGCFCAFANAFTTDADRPASTFGSLLEPDDMGCMDCSGNSDFGLRIPHIKAIVNQWGAIMDTAYIDAAENTPVLSFHGDQDILVPYVYGYPFQLPVFPKVYGSVPIHERLTNAGIFNVFHPLVGYGHEPELLAPNLNDTIYNYTRPFLFEILKPVTSAITGDTALCSGTLGAYSVVNTPGSRYCWSVSGNGNIVSNTGNAITVLWADTGLATISVKEINQALAEGEVQSFQTQVVPHAQSNFSYTTNELDVEFTNLASNAYSYYWNFGDGTFATDTTPATKSYLSGGSYTASLYAANNFCADTFSASFAIDSCPVADITYQLTNFNGFFYTPSTNTGSYFWNFGDGDSAAVASPNVFHQYGQNGEYTITLQVQNELGCKAVDTMTVTVAVATAVNNLTGSAISIALTPTGDLQVVGLTNFEQHNYYADIFDVLGRAISHDMLDDSHTTLSTSTYAAGVYILRLSNGVNSYTAKFVMH